jgi:hypothetical protein
MKKNVLVLAVIAAVAIAMLAMSSDADQPKGSGAKDRDQSQMELHDKDRLHDRERIQLQDPSQLKDEDIYGHDLMSPEELNQYRERLRLIETEQERLKFEARHREEMQKRAKALKTNIEDAD